jgi:hypothetical protein
MTSSSVSSRLPAICCIPTCECASEEENPFGCCGAIDSDANMVIHSGQFRYHAEASRDVKAGTVLVQCLPFAHSLLVPPGMQVEDAELDDNDSGIRKRCTRCFFQEGDSVIDRIVEGFGRCSKCRVVYYCSRSCQVRFRLKKYATAISHLLLNLFPLMVTFILFYIPPRPTTGKSIIN